MTQTPKHKSRVIRIGLMVPSSNTVVETMAPKLIPADGSVALHFARLSVTSISGSARSKAQFEMNRMVETAKSLADVEPSAIAWAGTAASWLGFDRDEDLVRHIKKATGVPATTSLLAVNEALQELGARRIGLVTPYVAALERDIITNYAAIGIEVTAAERLNLTVNTDYAKVPERRIGAMCRAVARSKPNAIVIMCTNLNGALIAVDLGKSLGLPVIDSLAGTLANALRIARCSSSI